MKKIFLLSLSAAFALSSCTKLDGITPTYEDNLTFTSSINSASTRVSGSAFDEGDAISVFASDGAQYVAENVKYEFVSSLFTSSSPIVSDGSALSFVAAYPYSSDMAVEGTFAVAISQSTKEAYCSSDLLIAHTSATTETCPELIFNHALSAIEVNITTSKEISEVIINAATEVNYNLVNSLFEASGSAVAVTPLEVSEASYSAIVAPQTIATGSALLEVTVDGETAIWNVASAVELLSGYKYVCNVTVTDNDVIFEGEIAPWSDGGEIDATVGGDDSSHTLSWYSADNYPTTSTWVVSDTEAATDDFAGLKAALTAAYTAYPELEVSLVLDNMVSVPDEALESTSGSKNYNMVSISLPAATTIGGYAFSYSEGLVSLDMPVVEVVGERAFYNSSNLASISAPKVVTIEDYAFRSCYAIETVTFETVTSIGEYAFAFCYALTDVSLPAVEVLGASCFRSDTALETFSAPKADSVAKYAFYQSKALKSVSLPSARVIEQNAFDTCESLISLDVSSVETIGEEAFIDCTILPAVDLPKAVTIGEAAFRACDALTSVILPEALTLDSYAFGYCDVLSSVSLPKAVSIGASAFVSCDLLATFSAPELTTIGASAFAYDESLVDIQLPKAETIGELALRACDALENFTIGANVTSIGDAAFISCDLLANLVVESPNFAFEGGVLYDADKTYAICALSAALDKDVVLPDTVEEIGEYAFYLCTEITSVSLPGVKVIGESGFRLCSSMTSIYTPKVTTTGQYALRDCTSLLAIDMPEVTELGKYTFYQCETMTSANFAVLTSIGQYAFYYCYLLSEVTGPALTALESRAFYSCPVLGTLTMATNAGTKLSSINSYAFSGTAVTTNVDLVLGADNAEYVSENTLTVGTYSKEFKSITLL